MEGSIHLETLSTRTMSLTCEPNGYPKRRLCRNRLMIRYSKKGVKTPARETRCCSCRRAARVLKSKE